MTRNVAYLLKGGIVFLAGLLVAFAVSLVAFADEDDGEDLNMTAYELELEIEERQAAYAAAREEVDAAAASMDETLERFAAAGDWLEEFDPDSDEMEGYIVSTVATHDAPVKPRAVMRRQDATYFAKAPEGYRDRMRAEMLGATSERIRSFAPALRQAGTSQAVCVFGNAGIIEASVEPLERKDLFG